MLTADQFETLRARLRAAHYTLDAVTDRLGPAAAAGLARNTTFAASDALGSASDPQASLIRLWLLQDAVPAADLVAALGDLDPWVAAGLLVGVQDAAGAPEPAGAAAGSIAHERLRATVEIRPYAAGASEGADADEGFQGWVCHDLIPTLDGRIDPARTDFVLGASPASTTLAQLTVRAPVERALDLGTGCGIQVLHLARHAREIVATDLNPRAVELAALTAGLNGLDVDLRTGSLYEPVAGESFDLIVTNPPYVMSPPVGERLTYREGTLVGDELVRRVVTEGAALLRPGGTLQVLGNWAITEDEPWQDRLRAWVEPTGCDALVLMRERLDPYEYVEIWLNDAGLAGAPGYAARYREWLDYFAGLGITGVGMGWIALRRPRDDRAAHLSFEDWPHAVADDVGAAFGAHFAGVERAAHLSDAELLATAWTLEPRATQETIGRPGAADPEHIVLRQNAGFGRAITVDTALAAVLGASDGDLTAGQLVGAVAGLLDVDAAALASEITPRLRDLVREGWLT